MDGYPEQQHTIQPGLYSFIQCERVLLGFVQDFQAVQADGACAVQLAGLPALPRTEFTCESHSPTAGRLPQRADVSSGPGMGERPHHKPLQVGITNVLYL